jgi:hypothetical protein
MTSGEFKSLIQLGSAIDAEPASGSERMQARNVEPPERSLHC